LIAMQSPAVQSCFAEATRTLAQPTLNVGLIEAVSIPLPPLAEQHRIVTKVEELMSLCDRLERALQDATTTRARLLEATLRDALTGAQEAA
jgi:type I restriction enzyme S subunit